MERVCCNCGKELSPDWKRTRCNSCTITLHRQRMKKACVEYMDTTCIICGYDKCVAALEFHHKNPDEKEFGIAQGGITYSWDKIYKELKKCVMICSNCHKEIHYFNTDINHIEIKHNQNKFVNSLRNNDLQPRGIKKVVDKISCKECGTEIQATSKRCLSCHNKNMKRKTKIIWPELDELMKMLQGSSFLSVGRKLGVSDNAIRKHLKKNDIEYKKIKENEMYKRNGDFEVVIRAEGRVVESVENDGKLYILGEPGREYTISIRNRTWRDAEAIVSVDGLSVMTGDDASSKDSGYLVRKRSTYEIRGWRLNNDSIAKFNFGEKGEVGESYAALSGKPKNIGVIGVSFFLEKQKTVFRTPLISKSPKKYRGRLGREISNESFSYNVDTRGGETKSSGEFLSAIPMSDSDGFELERARGLTEAPAGGDIGTGFGKEASDHVREVEFERDYSTKSTLAIEYGSRQNLIKRGILNEKPVVANPFPADEGCTPPKGWRG
jgi:hypothetical protein